MKKRAVHIYLSTFEHESRIIKQTRSLIEHEIVSDIYIVAKWKPGLKESEELSKGIHVRRLKTFRFKLLGNMVKFARNLNRRGVQSETVAANQTLSQNLEGNDKKPIIRVKDIAYYSIKKTLEILHTIQISLLVLKIRPDYLNLHHVDLLHLVFLKKFVKNMRVIYDTHELETETQSSVGLLRRKRKNQERKLIVKVDYTFVVTPSIEKWYRKAYGIDRISTIRNVPFFQNVPQSNKSYFREKYGLGPDDHIFLYQGALFLGRGLRYLLQAFADINDRKYSVVFMGYGELSDEIDDFARRYPNIFRHEPVSPEILLDYTVAADIGVALTENVCLSYYYGLGNKIFEYTMSELPLLVSNMLDMADYVSKYQIGVVVKSFELDDIVASIKGCAEMMNPELKANIKRAKEENNWEIESKTMIQAYRDFLS